MKEKTKHIGLRLPVSLVEQIEAKAAEEETTFSNVVRSAIRAYIEK